MRERNKERWRRDEEDYGKASSSSSLSASSLHFLSMQEEEGKETSHEKKGLDIRKKREKTTE